MWGRSFVQAPLPQPKLHSKWQSPTLHNVQVVPKTLTKVKVPSCKMFNWSPKEKPPPNSHLAKSSTGPQNPFKSEGFPRPLSSTKFNRPEILLKVKVFFLPSCINFIWSQSHFKWKSKVSPLLSCPKFNWSQNPIRSESLPLPSCSPSAPAAKSLIQSGFNQPLAHFAHNRST